VILLFCLLSQIRLQSSDIVLLYCFRRKYQENGLCYQPLTSFQHLRKLRLGLSGETPTALNEGLPAPLHLVSREYILLSGRADSHAPGLQTGVQVQPFPDSEPGPESEFEPDWATEPVSGAMAE